MRCWILFSYSLIIHPTWRCVFSIRDVSVNEPEPRACVSNPHRITPYVAADKWLQHEIQWVFPQLLLCWSFVIMSALPCWNFPLQIWTAYVTSCVPPPPPAFRDECVSCYDTVTQTRNTMWLVNFSSSITLFYCRWWCGSFCLYDGNFIRFLWNFLHLSVKLHGVISENKLMVTVFALRVPT